MPEGRPRASKITTSWQPKQKKKPRKKQPRRKVQRSKHPMVKLIKMIEQEGLEKDAAIAGFQSEHEHSSREIAKVKLPNGNVKRTYTCDGCGYVVSRESKS